MGRHYVLVNWETDKNVIHRGGVALRVGPFLDTGRVLGSVERQRWLWDAGVQAKLGILGRVALALSYGRDLGAGRNAFYALSR
jgi:hypothetical protein